MARQGFRSSRVRSTQGINFISTSTQPQSMALYSIMIDFGRRDGKGECKERVNASRTEEQEMD